MLLTKKSLLMLGILIFSLNTATEGRIPQDPYLMFGHIYESNGTVIEGAKVMITNLNTSDSTYVFTNNLGQYVMDSLGNLPHGYSIGDHIRIDAEKDTKTGHKSLILVDFLIFDKENSDGINIYLTPYKLHVESNPKTLKADGVSNSNITVTLMDNNNTPIETEIDTTINLSTDLGNITNQIIIYAGNSSGSTVLQSSDKSGIATVSAKSKGLVGDYIKVGFVGEGTPLKLKITTNKKSIPADGKSTVTISLSLWDVNNKLVLSKKDRDILITSTLGDLSTNKVKIAEDEAILKEDIIISSMSGGNGTITADSEGLETATETIIFMPLIWWYSLAGIGGIIGGMMIAIIRRKKGIYYYEQIPFFPVKDNKGWHLGTIGIVSVSFFIGIFFFIIINLSKLLPQNYSIALVVGFAGGIGGLRGLEKIIEKYLR